MSDYNDVRIEEDSIKLGQFLKLANLIDSGGEAKQVLAGGIVRASTARSRPAAAASSSAATWSAWPPTPPGWAARRCGNSFT